MKTIDAAALFEALKEVKLGGSTCLFTPEKCEKMAPVINEINRLKVEKNAIILAHSYVGPEIIHGVADFTGDSYELSKKAKATNADTVVFVAVKFMAETAAILNPGKQVLIPSRINGCSLADAITAADVRLLRRAHPDASFVCYINTTADVKAECDVCVTSSNVVDIVAAIPNDEIYFLPDKLMGENVKQALAERGIEKTVHVFDGTCYVHEEYDPEMIRFIKGEYPGVEVLSHPECDSTVVSESDFVGSTSQMINRVKASDSDSFFMLTECGLTSRLQLEVPEKRFVGTCTMCKYMKSNRLEDIKRVLEGPEPEDIITLDETIRHRAQDCIDKMFEYAVK